MGNVRERSSIGALKWGKWRLNGVRSRIPAQWESNVGNVREMSSIGAMDHVQKASTHTGRVAADGARVKGDGASIDVDTAALHPRKEISVQRGDGRTGNAAFEWHALTPPCQERESR